MAGGEFVPTFFDRGGKRWREVCGCGRWGPAVYIELCHLGAGRAGGWGGSVRQLTQRVGSAHDCSPRRGLITLTLKRLVGIGILSLEHRTGFLVFRIEREGGVDTGVATVDTGVATVDTGVSTPGHRVDTGVSTVDTGVSTVDTGVATVDTGVATVDTGVSTLKEGEERDTESESLSSPEETEEAVGDGQPTQPPRAAGSPPLSGSLESERVSVEVARAELARQEWYGGGEGGEVRRSTTTGRIRPTRFSPLPPPAATPEVSPEELERAEAAREILRRIVPDQEGGTA